MPEFLPRLRQGVPVALPDGDPTPEFILFWQEFANSIETIPGLEQLIADAQAAADAANAAAENADDAAAAVTSESSLVNSFPTNYTAPLITATSTGGITIANHDRQYGDATLNPTVAVTGSTFSSTAINPEVVRVYYDDPTRAGGAVSYQHTIDPADPPVQGGVRHSVGAVTIPAAGSQGGGAVNPPGYAEP